MEKMILSLYLVAVTASFVAATTTSATDTTSSTSSTTQTPTTASTTTEKMIDNSIVITKLWNGTELQDDSDQVVLRFTNTDENELQVRMEAISGTITTWPRTIKHNIIADRVRSRLLQQSHPVSTHDRDVSREAVQWPLQLRGGGGVLPQ